MRLGTKITNPGEMRTKITLQSRTTVQDAGGFSIPGWATIATVWSRWINAHGREILEAAIAQVDAPATVLIRYRNDVDTACAVLKGSLRYEIVSIDNIQERNEYLELRVQRMKAG
jgi:SPP1 family predicted phage head-tail adaptor